MAGLEAVVEHLEQAGIMGDLWVNGSLLTQAIDPADADIVLRVSAEFFDAVPPETRQRNLPRSDRRRP